MSILDRIVRPGEHVVDVGGNRGVYAYKLQSLGCTVEVFEPNSACCGILEAWLRGKDDVRLHRVALSSDQGEANLQIPVDEAGVEHDASASLEHGFANARSQTVPTRTLDSFGFVDISLIKIDVEGHERRVLAGAARTIQVCEPALLVEIEQRHNAESIVRIFESLEDNGYRGYFLDPRAACLRSVRDFSVDEDQQIAQFVAGKGRYINNFLFLHKHRIAEGRYRTLDIPGP
jgi:FkbM family methyltransferase